MTDRSDLEIVDMNLYTMKPPKWHEPGRGHCIPLYTPWYRRVNWGAIAVLYSVALYGPFLWPTSFTRGNDVHQERTGRAVDCPFALWHGDRVVFSSRGCHNSSLSLE